MLHLKATFTYFHRFKSVNALCFPLMFKVESNVPGTTAHVSRVCKSVSGEKLRKESWEAC